MPSYDTKKSSLTMKKFLETYIKFFKNNKIRIVNENYQIYFSVSSIQKTTGCSTDLVKRVDPADCKLLDEFITEKNKSKLPEEELKKHYFNHKGLLHLLIHSDDKKKKRIYLGMQAIIYDLHELVIIEAIKHMDDDNDMKGYLVKLK